MKTTPLSEPIEIFRAGRRTAMDGAEHVITEADLAASVAAYDPQLSEAPIVVGHPATNHPAYGWVKALSVEDGVLKMHAHQVEPQFAEMVEAGRFKKRSVAFYTPDHPNNPKPGTWYLRHVGWLGAQPPAVQGLKDVQFSADDSDIVNFSVSERRVATLFRSLRDWFIGEFGQEKADRVLPSWEVSALEEHASMEDVLATANSPSFSAPPIQQEESDMDKDAQIAAEKAAREKAEREAAEMKAQLAAFAENQVRARHAAHVAFAETEIAAGRVLPKDKDALVAALDVLSAAKPAEFGEGDGKKTVDLSEWMKGRVTAGPKLVQFGEHAPGDMNDAAAAVDDTDLHKKATDYAKQHNVSYSEALNKIAAFVA